MCQQPNILLLVVGGGLHRNLDQAHMAADYKQMIAVKGQEDIGALHRQLCGNINVTARQNQMKDRKHGAPSIHA
jgi:hypothetical protein